MIRFEKYSKERKQQQETLSLLSFSYRNERQKFSEFRKEYKARPENENATVNCVISRAEIMIDNSKRALRTHSITLVDKQMLCRRCAQTLSDANRFLRKYLIFNKLEKRDLKEAEIIAARALCISEYAFGIYLHDTTLR